MKKLVDKRYKFPVCLSLCMLVLCVLLSSCRRGDGEATTSQDTYPPADTTLPLSPETTAPETEGETENIPDTTVIPEIYEAYVYVYDSLDQSVKHTLKPGETLPSDLLEDSVRSTDDRVSAELRGYEYSIVKDGERKPYDLNDPPAVTEDGMHIYPIIEYSYLVSFDAGEGEFPDGVAYSFFVRSGETVKVSDLLSKMPEKAADAEYAYPLAGFMLDGKQLPADLQFTVEAPAELVAVYDKEELSYIVNISTEVGELIGGGKTQTILCNYREAEKLIESYNRYSSQDVYLHDALHDFVGITVTKEGREWTIVLNWSHTDIRYTVTFDYGDGQEAVLSQISADGNVILPTPERREDKERYYDFVGWRDKDGQLYNGGAEITVSESMSFSAEFVPSARKVYTIVFNTKVGVFSDGSASLTLTGYYGDELTLPKPPSDSSLRVGDVVFEFVGWDAEPPAKFTDNLTFNAVYTTPEPVYYLNFYIDGELYLSVPYYASAEILAPERPEMLAGLIFSGWTDMPEKMPESDTDVYATSRMPEIVYMLDGEVFSRTEAKAGTLVTLAAPAQKYGHTVSGWSTEDIDSLSDGGFVMPEKDVVFSALSSPNPHTVKYIIDGNTVYSDSVFFGDIYTVRGIEVKTGYNFTGWKIQSPSLDAEIGIISVPDEDVVFVGGFERCLYKVNYYLDEILLYAEEYYYGDTVFLRPDEEQAGCTFTWNSSGADILSGVFSMPAGDVDIYGIFSDGDNKIIFIIDGKEYGSIGVTAGENVDLGFMPTRFGYTFTGWSCDETDVSTGEFIMPEGDIVLRGSFIPNAYDIYFIDIATGTVINTSHLDYGSSFSLGDRIYCDAGKISNGWVLLAGHAVKEGDKYIMPNSDVLFGVVWIDCLTLEIDEDYHIPYFALLYDEYGGCRYDGETKTVYISDPSIEVNGESEGIKIVYEYEKQ